MALVFGEWEFAVDTAPALPAIAERLRTGMQLAVVESGRGPDGRLDVPKLGEALFDWRFAGNRIAVHGFAPPHPYLWEHLDAALNGLGGRPVRLAHGWQPNATYASLRRPWAQLSNRQRALLRLPTVGASRPLDRLLP